MKPAAEKVLIRSDASETIGLGHVMRDMVLAEQLASAGFDVAFAALVLPDALARRITEAGYGLHRLTTGAASELAVLLKIGRYAWLVVDHYGIDAAYEQAVKAAAPVKILAFDDTYRPHSADVVLNHGIQARVSRYAGLVGDGTKVLCGSDYTLLRREFLQPSGSRVRRQGRFGSALVTLGGTDVRRLSLRMVRLLKHIVPGISVTVATTSANPDLARLRRYAPAYGFTLAVDARDMCGLMRRHDLVIAASGGTLFETLAVRKPFININVASNQDEITGFLKRRRLHTTLERVDRRRLEDTLHYLTRNRRHINRETARIKFRSGRIPSVMKALS